MMIRIKKSVVLAGLLTSVLLIFNTGANATLIAQFDDPAYVNSHGGLGDESDTIEASLLSLGHTVSTFTGTSSAAWSSALAGNEVVVIPEQESGAGLGSALNSSSAGDALRSFVSNGGGLVISYDYRDFLDTIFGFSTSLSGAGTSTLNAGNAAGTTFAGGPASLPSPSATGALLTSSLPAGSTPIYELTTSSIVAILPYGAGEIAFLGWDWFNAAPLGSQDSGWLDVLDRSVLQVAGTAAVPEPATLALFGIGLVGMGFARRKKKSA